MRKTIAIDFDGVIHKYTHGFRGGNVFDEPMEGAMEGIRALQDRGYDIVVFTARTDFEPVHEWLMKYWPADGGEIPEVTNVKPRAVAYIDDHAIRFTNWRDITNYF